HKNTHRTNPRTAVSLVSLAAAALSFAAPGAFAQTNVTTTNKYAWSENCGFLNWRDAGSPVGAQGAFVGARVLFGFVWGENIGWVNLDDAADFVSTYCPADFNGDGVVNVSDIFAFLAAWFAGNPRANASGLNGIDVQDIFTFLAQWFSGC